MKKPKGIAGISWGMDALDALRRLGLEGGSWLLWPGDARFEQYSGAGSTLRIFDRDADVHLFRRESRIEGIELVFRPCADYPSLDTDVRREFGIDDSESQLYQVWSSGELVRLAHDVDGGECVLTVVGPALGSIYAAYLLKRGLRDLTNSAGPH